MDRYTIIIPFHHPWKWHTDYTNQTAVLLSKKHVVICFLWSDAVSIKEIFWNKKSFHLLSHPSKNLYLFQPIHVFPLYRLSPIRLINLVINTTMLQLLLHSCIKAKASGKRILWIFGFFEEPLFIFLPLLFPGALLYYDCLDIIWHPVPWVSKLLLFAENQLVKKARWMSVNSHTLFEKWTVVRPTIILVPSGAPNITHKRTPKNASPKDRRPTIGYIGAIGYRLDFSLLTRIIQRNPQWQFLLAGPIFLEPGTPMVEAMTTMRALPNVTFTRVDKQKIPNLLASSDIGIIPYDTNQTFNRYSFPLKLMEYFLAELPVVSTDIYELRRFPEFVAIGNSVSEWKNHIKHFLAHPLTQGQKNREKIIARNNSWEQKLNTIMRIIQTDAPKSISRGQ